MASGINSTMSQVGVPLGFAGLGSILSGTVIGTLNPGTPELEPIRDQMPALSRSVISRDVAGPAASLSETPREPFTVAAQTAFPTGLHGIALAAAAVGIVGAAITYLLQDRTKPTVTSTSPDNDPG